MTRWEKQKRWRLANLEKAREATRRWRAKNLERAREQGRKAGRARRARLRDDPEFKAKAKRANRKWRLKRRYGLTPEMVEGLLLLQGGICIVCREDPAIVVDHDHKTGRPRGLLCGLCNLGLGAFKDSPERLLKAIRYLRRHIA